MKKMTALTLGVSLTAALSLPALAASSQPQPVIAPAPSSYVTTLCVNGNTNLGAVELPGSDLLPLRMIAEADHGSAYWDEENNSGSFYLDKHVVDVDFATGTITVDDEPVEGTAQVRQGVTYVPAAVVDGIEGYSVDLHPELDVYRIDVTTPNSDPMIQLIYQLSETANLPFGMKTSAAELEEYQCLSVGVFTKGVGLLPMMTSPDTIIIGKVAEGKLDQAKADLEAYRKSQEDTFSWYLSQNLPKVQNAQVAVSGDWICFVIAENAEAAVEQFQAAAGSLE